MNKLKFTSLCFAVSALAIAGGVSLASNNKEESVSAYSTSSLPTTIDLNDTSASNIRSYYSSLNNLSTSERQGTNLLKNLKTILKNGQKYYSYDSGNAIWQIYEIADRDWTKSPASSTTYGTYNSGTNKITNYTYGTSSSSSKNNPYIHALYINRNVTNQTTAWDDHQQTQWGINREHVWPKAEGFETSGAGGARGDPMHLMAGNGYANNIHSNYYYGYVNTSSSYTNCGSKYSNISGNLLGKSKTLGGSTNVFEPQDCDKGDIARAIFYMVARYNYYSKSDSDGIDSNNPNLVLTQSLSDWASSGYSSTTSTTGKMGIMTDLLAWHHADPVDEYEIHRNNLLYTNYTNNRNPFIDFPEWADFIWGSVNYNGSTYISHSTTPTGYATPSSDTINGYNSGGGSDPVAVTGVSLNTNSTSVQAGKDVTLTATVAPNNATNQNVTWTTSNASIATVSGGIVTGVAEGSATITVTTNDGGFTATCSVTVTAAPEGEGEASVTIADYATANSWVNGTKYTSIPLDEVIAASVETGSSNTGKYYTSGNEWRYYQGESAAIKIEAASGYELDSVTFTYNISNTGVLLDSNSNTVTSGSSVSLSGSSAIFTVGNTGSATNGQVKFTSITVTYHVSSTPVPTLSSISVKTAPTKISYYVGEDFVPIGLVITGTYSDSSTTDISYEDNEDLFEFDPSENLQTSDASVTISYGGKSTTQAITVTAAVPTSITATVSKTFYVGETITKSDITVEDNLGNTIASSDFSFSNNNYQFTYSDAASGGTLTSKTFTNAITYSNLTCSLTVQVQRKAYVTPALVWRSVTDVSSLAAGDKVLITGINSDVTYGCGTYSSGNNVQSAGTLTISNNVVTAGVTNSMIYTLAAGSVSNTFAFKDSSNKYLYAASSGYNYMKSQSSIDGNASFTISLQSSTFTIYANGTNSRKYMRFNPNSGNPIFSCYAQSSTVGSTITLYKQSSSNTPSNLSNYIMYEDTNDQCTTKFNTAIGYLGDMSSSDRTTFASSSDYVIATARERLEAWARHLGKTIDYSNGTVSGAKTIDVINGGLSTPILILIVASAVGAISIGGYFFLRRKEK